MVSLEYVRSSRNQVMQERIENALLDSIVAAGVRDNGTVRDLDTLIIDREKSAQAIMAVFEESEAEIRDSEQNSIFAVLRHLGVEHDAKAIMKVRKDWDKLKQSKEVV
jgi:hypothetical protein